MLGSPISKSHHLPRKEQATMTTIRAYQQHLAGEHVVLPAIQPVLPGKAAFLAEAWRNDAKTGASLM